MEKFPDLDSGRITLGSDNLWSVEIQSVLHTETGGETHYLCHECRMENVPFSPSPSFDDESIFLTQKPWEFLVRVSNGQAFQLPGSEIGSINPGHGAAAVLPEQELNLQTVQVFCPDRPGRAIGLDEALTRLRSRKMPVARTYLEIVWSGVEGECRLYAPARYVNFGADKGPASNYIQPISGYVLYPLQGRLLPAYAACSLHADGRCTIEFDCRIYRNALHWLLGHADMSESGREMVEPLLEQLPLYLLMFDAVQKVEGRFRLFEYLTH